MIELRLFFVIPTVATLIGISTMGFKPAEAQEVTLEINGVLADNSVNLEIVPNSGYLIDHSRQLSIGTVISKKDDAFIRTNDRQINLGLTSSILWVKYEIPNRLRDRSDLFLVVPNPILDYVSAYFVTNGDLSVLHAGDRVEFSERPMRHRLHVFPFPADATRLDTIYIRVAGATPLRFQATIAAPLLFERKEAEVLFIRGIFYGLMLALFCYNLFLCFAVRDMSQVYYLGYLSSAVAIAAVVDGVPAHFGHWQWWPRLANEMAVFITHALVYCGVKFVREYLRTNRPVPLNTTFLDGLSWVILACAAASTLCPPRTDQFLLMGIVALTLVSLLSTIIYFSALGVRQAKILGVTIIALAVPTGLWLAGSVGLSGSGHGVLHLGFGLEAILLSLALADRINQMRSERLAAEQELTDSKRAFTEQLIYTQEEERRSVSRDLHDSIGQTVLALKAKLDRWAKQADTASAIHFHDASEVTISIATAARELAHRLHPNILERLGLREALLSLLAPLADIPIKADFDLPTQLDILDDETALIIYRVMQEAVANLMKHSEATQCTLRARFTDHTLEVQLEDNGIGRVDTLKKSKSFGLRAMRERAAMLNGLLTFADANGHGIQVLLTIPLNESHGTTE